MPIVKTVQPTTLTLVITRRCSAQCRNCCSQCSPYKQQEIPLDDAIGYIDKALNAFPSIKVLVITGGECMLNVEKLNEIISYGNKYGLVVRIVTNCFWATSQEKADRLVEALVKNGLQEINFSTGDEHQEFVPLENIVYAVIASLEHNLTCVVNVESHIKSRFKADNLKNHPLIKEYLTTHYNKKLIVENGLWIKMRDKDPFLQPKSEHNISFCSKMKMGCNSILTSININPYHFLMSCCGLTSEYIPHLRIGYLKNDDMKQCYLSQYEDLMKLWIFTSDPTDILNTLKRDMGLMEQIPIQHACMSCAELFMNPVYADFVQKHIDQYANNIITAYEMKYQTLLKNNQI